MVVELTRRMRAYYEVPDGVECPASLLEYVAAWIEDGNTLRKLATEVGSRIGWQGMSSGVIGSYLRANYGAETDRALSAARSRASHVLAEESLDILDDEPTDAVHATMLRERAKARQWLASNWNRDAYGNNKGGAQVSITFGAMHLDALRARQVSATVLAGNGVTAQPAALAEGDMGVPALPAPSSVTRTEDAEVVE